MLISVKGTGKNQPETRQESMGDAQVLPRCSILKKSLTKINWCAGALSRRRNKVGLPFFGVFPLTASLRQ
jgi:hypothetical protein